MTATPAAALALPATLPELEPVSCALCGGNSPIELYPPLPEARNLSPAFAASTGVRGVARIVRCPDCELRYVSPRLPAGHILAAYRDAIDPYYVAQADARRRAFGRTLRQVARYACRGRLLDVGCAAGYFLDVARDAGWNAQGVEPNLEFVRLARKRHADAVHEGTLAELAAAAAEPFDVITMWDMLEHSTDPRSEIAAAYRLLRPGGLLFVNFPNIASMSARLTGSAWWFLLSHHLFYFSPATLGRLLESEGFGVIARTSCRQTLELGYLAGMLRLYSPGMAVGLQRALAAARLHRLPLSYYAGQVTLVAAK